FRVIEVTMGSCVSIENNPEVVVGACTFPPASWPPVTRTSMAPRLTFRSSTLYRAWYVVALVQLAEAKLTDGAGFVPGKLNVGATVVFIGSLKVAVNFSALLPTLKSLIVAALALITTVGGVLSIVNASMAPMSGPFP